MCVPSPGKSRSGDQHAEQRGLPPVFISSIREPGADRGLEAPSPENAEATERDAKGEHLAILNETIE